MEIVEDYPSSPTLREDDKFLMKCFMESGYSRVDLKKLNYVRTYLKVVTLADITTSDGKIIPKNHTFVNVETVIETT